MSFNQQRTCKNFLENNNHKHIKKKTKPVVIGKYVSVRDDAAGRRPHFLGHTARQNLTFLSPVAVC